MAVNIILDKSKAFAVRVTKLYQHLSHEKKEFVLSKQVLRCGTSIGANVREAHHGQSKRDFISKMNIALKEAMETRYWLKLLKETDQFSEDAIMNQSEEIIRILIKIVKTATLKE